jgi:ADP-heptose:LPS heptosyltransferase
VIAGRQDIVPRIGRGAAVCVVRLRSMGDTVLTTPALALLKQARPDLRIFVVLERVWEPLLAGNSDVAGVIPLEPRLKAIAAIRRLKPGLCLNLHGGSTSAWLTALSGARWRAGFGHFARQFVYNVRIPRAQEVLGLAADAAVHTAEHLASAMFYLGVPPAPIPPAKLFAPEHARRRPYAVVHVGAAYHTKQWPVDRFAEAAGWLRADQGLEPVVLAGPGEGHLLAGLRDFECFDHLPLPEMMSLIRGAELFVGNDSGPAHVAAAFGVPCVVLFGSSNSQVWHPWGTRYEVVETAWECKPCPGDRCYAFDEPRCILSVEADQVKRAVQAVLAARPAVRHA